MKKPTPKAVLIVCFVLTIILTAFVIAFVIALDAEPCVESMEANWQSLSEEVK